ncbi:MAG: phosphatidylglycerophosphatase A [Kiritimatiellia bacterium]
MGWKGIDPYEGQRPEATLGASFCQRLSVWMGTGFGIGLVAPFAPGTFGSIPGVALAVAFSIWLPVWIQIPLCLLLTLLAVPICTTCERALKKKDDGRISADEWMLYPLATIGLPLTACVWLIPVTFVVIRILDILKLPPACHVQYLPEGWGIVADDFISQLYALAINWALWIWVLQ